MPFRWCQIHHIWWWSVGGPTDVENLIPYCWAHRYVHEFDYTVTREAGGLTHRDAHGCVIPDPDPHLHTAIGQLRFDTDPSDPSEPPPEDDTS